MRRRRKLEILSALLRAAQRSRSACFETLAEQGIKGGAAERKLVAEDPWLFDDDRRLLVDLSDAVSRLEAGGDVAMIEMYNFVWLASLSPGLAAGIWIEDIRGSDSDMRSQARAVVGRLSPPKPMDEQGQNLWPSVLPPLDNPWRWKAQDA